MKVLNEITNKNFKFVAARSYNNPECSSIEEFNEDLCRFKYVKRLFSRYELEDDLQERLILNHLIVIYNVFGIEAANRLMWFKVSPEHYSILKTFLVFLSFLKEEAYIDIPLDPNIVERLRDI
tara:strand:+ start:659 stop:1027 length:369 start_codon:yes stop_codon:yes gene_type:complete